MASKRSKSLQNPYRLSLKVVCRPTFFRFSQSLSNRSQMVYNQFGNVPGVYRDVISVITSFSTTPIGFLNHPKSFTKSTFFEGMLIFHEKSSFSCRVGNFFYKSIWHLRMCPLSFEYFGTLSRTSRAKFLISYFILKKFNFSIFSKSFKSFLNVVQLNWDGPRGLKGRN